MEYNTARNKLNIPEYGRNVQKLIEHALTISDRDERTRLAHFIAQVMLNLNNGSNKIENEQKVWDHLFIISDFRLDVDAPYPMPDKEKVFRKPDKMNYSENNIKYRTYGKNMEAIIAKAVEMEEGEMRDALTELIAHNLKRAYLTWNRTSVDDVQIKEDLRKMSNGKLKLPDDFEFLSTADIIGKKRSKAKENTQRNHRSKQQRYQKSGRSNYSQNKRRNN
jgi:hypothetical protein